MSIQVSDISRLKQAQTKEAPEKVGEPMFQENIGLFLSVPYFIGGHYEKYVSNLKTGLTEDTL